MIGLGPPQVTSVVQISLLSRTRPFLMKAYTKSRTKAQHLGWSCCMGGQEASSHRLVSHMWNYLGHLKEVQCTEKEKGGGEGRGGPGHGPRSFLNRCVAGMFRSMCVLNLSHCFLTFSLPLLHCCASSCL